MDEHTEELMKRDKEVNSRIIAISEDKVFSKRAVVMIAAPVICLLLYLTWNMRNLTSDTHDTVTVTNETLVKENQQLEKKLATADDLLGQAVDAVVLLQGLLRDNGIEPPEILIRPTTTTTLED